MQQGITRTRQIAIQNGNGTNVVRMIPFCFWVHSLSLASTSSRFMHTIVAASQSVLAARLTASSPWHLVKNVHALLGHVLGCTSRGRHGHFDLRLRGGSFLVPPPFAFS